MSWSDDRITAGPPGAWDVAAAIAAGLGATFGLAGLLVGIITGSAPLAIAAFAVIFGTGLLPAIADWRDTRVAVEAIEQRNKEQTAIDGVQCCVETQTPSLTEARDRIKAYYAHLMSERYSGSGRFQERVSAEAAPGRERVH